MNPSPDAVFATLMEGVTGKGAVYVIGDYLYNHFGSKARPTYYLRCRKALKSAEFPCKATAKIHKKSLRVMNMGGEHSCERDPDIRDTIQHT